MRRTLAHVSAATDLAPVLLAFRVYASLEVEEAGGKEFGGVGDDLVELIGKAVVLKRASSINAGLSAPYDKKKELTAKTVLMKTELELERQKKVVLVGSVRALTAWTPRFIAGCCPRVPDQLQAPSRRNPSSRRTTGRTWRAPSTCSRVNPSSWSLIKCAALRRPAKRGSARESAGWVGFDGGVHVVGPLDCCLVCSERLPELWGEDFEDVAVRVLV